MPHTPHEDWDSLENWLNDDETDDRYCYYGPDDSDCLYEEEDDEEEFDCGFVPGYGCQLAGLEDCDWECPYSPALHNHPDYPNVVLAPLPYIKVVAPGQLADLLKNLCCYDQEDTDKTED